MALSRNAVDKLGERLRAGSTTEADWTLLEELRAERQRHLTEVVDRIRTELALPVSGRVKTTQTLVEKLQRERMRLSQMDDLAGARIRVDGTRLEQDQVVTMLLTIWPDARPKDRRAEPVHGYRAVHVIARIDGWPLEIQVRTLRQDTIANILESLADEWGRQIRYGLPPDRPDDPALPPYLTPTRTDFIQMAVDLADHVARLEDFRVITDAAEIDDPEMLAVMAKMEVDGDWLIRELAEMFNRRAQQ